MRGALTYFGAERFFRLCGAILRHDCRGVTYHLQARAARFPLMCRFGTSDRTVFAQIYIAREYACVDALNEPHLIIDCGANVGYTAAYFLSRFPGAHVIAIEPEAGNFEVLQRNMTPYGNSVITLRSAIWSHGIDLVVCQGQPGQEWMTQVRECRVGEQPEVQAVDISTLLDKSGFKRINLLKIDIEQAETVIFSKNYESWIDKVDAFVIELHNEESRDVFFQALSSARFDFSYSGELTFARRVH